MANGEPGDIEQTIAPLAEQRITLADFLENVPPGRRVLLAIPNLKRRQDSPNALPYLSLTSPQLRLFCADPACDRQQLFSPTVKETTLRLDHFLNFTCRNCGNTQKVFALRFTGVEVVDPARVYAQKLGELPQFGPPLPAKLIQLAGEYIEVLKKGRQSENQSLGIGAFAYYRRVVEAQKSRLIDELSNAIQRLGGNPAALTALEAARTENQFSRALELMAGVTPKELGEALLV